MKYFEAFFIIKIYLYIPFKDFRSSIQCIYTVTTSCCIIMIHIYNSLLIAKHAVLIIFTDRKVSNNFFFYLCLIFYTCIGHHERKNVFLKKISKLWFNKRRVWSMFFTFFKKNNNTELHRHWLLREKKKPVYGKVSCINSLFHY